MPKNSQTIWVVVLVESGIPTLVEAYPIQEIAAIREQLLRSTTNCDYDETGIFEVEIGGESTQSLRSQQGFQNRI